MKKKVSLSLSDFIKEHTHLIDVLNKGTKKDRFLEANKQMKEYLRVLNSSRTAT